MADIKVKAVCEHIIFSKDYFHIARFKALEVIEGELPISGNNEANSFVAKGECDLKEKAIYNITGLLQPNTKFGDQYKIIDIYQDVNLDSGNKEDFEQFLLAITSEKNASNIVNTLDDPAKVFADKDVSALQTVNGIGPATSQGLLAKYAEQIGYMNAFVELKKDGYNFTNLMVSKICHHFKGADLAVARVHENPYCLIDMPGMGFKSVDAIALGVGIKPNDPRRVEAYIVDALQQEASDGNSWVSLKEFTKRIGAEIPDCNIVEAFKFINGSKRFTLSKHDDDVQLALKRYADLEKEAAYRLRNILKNNDKRDFNNVNSTIESIEKSQGWKYSDDQVKAIHGMINNDAYLLQGLAGTGKSSTIRAVVEIFKKNGLNFIQCALSGKAANNLEGITHEKGMTIHSLLAYGRGDNGGFGYNEKNNLSYDVIIVDEISMVTLELFVSLLRAIGKGTKLIMLGDMGQLQPIGIGVMGDIIKSGKIPNMYLTKQHRQALNSGITSHSVTFRRGEIPDELSLRINTKRPYGALKDLEYVIVSKTEQEKILQYTIKLFQNKIKEYGRENVQILCSTRKSGEVSVRRINGYAQMAANPRGGAKEVKVETKDGTWYLRVGDRVINTRNNRKTVNQHEVPTPIYNGNTGVLLDILNTDHQEKDWELLIDFDGIGRVKVPHDSFNAIDLGYAMTVHKSQGSTIKSVIFAMPFHFLLNTRELVYTGMTRAADDLTVITTPYALRSAIAKTSSKQRDTNLCKYIIQVMKEK